MLFQFTGSQTFEAGCYREAEADDDDDEDEAGEADATGSDESVVKQYSPHAIPRAVQSVGHVLLFVK